MLNNENKKEAIIVNTSNDYLTCSICQKLTDSELIAKSRNGKYVCEECFDPLDPDQSEEEIIIADIEENKANSSDNNFFNTFTSDNKKTSEKATEILNIEELNNNIEIPKELNIVDCPLDVNADKDWFRKQFKNFWRLFNDDREYTFVIHDRGTGKSKQSAILILFNISMSANFEGAFVMRNWEEPTRQTKEYFKKLIREFDEKIWQGERATRDKSQWGLLWLSTYKGVSFKKDVKDKTGELRCHFFDLFSPESARTLINNPVRIVIFDECIPTRNQIKDGKGWKLDEGAKYMELMKSVGRLTKPKKIFTGNPNDSWRSCWMLTLYFSEELKEIEKWYWKNRPNNFAKWLVWEWTKEFQKDNKVLQLKKIARQKEDFPTYEDDNWDNFFARMEDLKIVEHKNGAVPQHVFNNCIQYVSKQNYFYYIDINSKEISARDRQLLRDLPEIFVNDNQRLKSKQLAKWDRRGEMGIKFQQSLLRNYETGMLFFADMVSKDRMEEYLGKRKTFE